MKTFREFNDSITYKMKPITSKYRLIQWLNKLKFNKTEVIHRNDIIENPNDVLKQLSNKMRYSKGNLSIVVVEE